MGTTPTTPSSSGATQRQRIVAAAVGLHAESGAGLTMRTVGAQVGLHNSSLFHHFRRKEEILAALQESINASLCRELEPLRVGAPSLAQLVTVLQSLSDHLATAPAEARCALRLLLDPVDAAAADGARFTTILWSWLARAQAAGVIRPVSVGYAARYLLGILLLDPAWRPIGRAPERDAARRRAELAAFVRGALEPADAPSRG